MNTMNTRFYKPFVASALMQPAQPAIKPIAISSTTGSRADSTGLFIRG
jgi:hypothetical protein